MGLVLQVQARVREVDGDDMPSPFTQCGWRTHTRTHQDALSMFTLLYMTLPHRLIPIITSGGACSINMCLQRNSLTRKMRHDSSRIEQHQRSTFAPTARRPRPYPPWRERLNNHAICAHSTLQFSSDHVVVSRSFSWHAILLGVWHALAHAKIVKEDDQLSAARLTDGARRAAVGKV
jgi:hypothetical protein